MEGESWNIEEAKGPSPIMHCPPEPFSLCDALPVTALTVWKLSRHWDKGGDSFQDRVLVFCAGLVSAETARGKGNRPSIATGGRVFSC